MTIRADGKVGIGTTSPENYDSSNDNLVVYGSGHSGITIASGTGNTGGLMFADGTSGVETYRGYISYSHGNDHLVLGASSSPIAYFKSGNVGIGTNNPGAKLDILGDTDTWAGMAKIMLTDTSGNAARRNWAIGNGGSGYGHMSFVVSNAADGSPDNNTSGTIVMALDGVNKRVGIGTTTPTAKLHVIGDTIVTGNLTAKQLIVSSSVTNMTVAQASGSTKFGDTVSLDTHQFSGSLSVSGSITLNGSAVTSGGGGGSSVWSTNGNKIYYNTDNVGIGTNNPDTTLDIHGSFTLDGNGAQAQMKLRADQGDGQAIYFTNAASGYEGAISYDNTGTTAEKMQFNVNQGTRMTILASGNVGIGTDNPAVTFHVKNTSNQVARFENANGALRIVNVSVSDNFGSGNRSVLGDHSQDVLITSSTSGGTPQNSFILLNHDGNVRIAAGGSPAASEGITVLDGGNVGIGTNNPSQKLHVHGGHMYMQTGYGITWNNGDASINARSGYNIAFNTYDGSNNTEKMVITSKGGVGIGTTTTKTGNGRQWLSVMSGSQHGFQYIAYGNEHNLVDNRVSKLRITNNAIGYGDSGQTGIGFSPYFNKDYA